MKKSILSVIPAAAMLLLLLFPDISFEGAKNGLLLWFNIVLPTLLPFMLISALIVAWGGVPVLTRPLSPLFRFFHLSGQGSYAFLCGLLCGYPMGAKTTADFVKSGELTSQEGKRLLAIAGAPSPMFLAGYVRLCLPGEIPFIFATAAMYLPVVLLIILSGIVYKVPAVVSAREKAADTGNSVRSFDELLMDSLEIMVKVGGYIMLFSILAAFADLFLPPGLFLKPLLLGFIEMTTGIKAISTSMSSLPAAAAIIASAAFGGLSGVFQTNTVIKNAGLSIRHYVLWKLLHAGLSALILILAASL